MTVVPIPGADASAFGAAVHAANAQARAAAAAPASHGIKAVQDQGTPKASQHIVSGKKDGVDDGAHGLHDYDDVDMHPAVLGRFNAHGARLDNHDDRIKRLEGSIQADLGSPGHSKG